MRSRFYDPDAEPFRPEKAVVSQEKSVWFFVSRSRIGVVYALAVGCLISLGCQSFRQQLKDKPLFSLGKQEKSDDIDLSEEVLDPLGARDADRLLWDDLAPSQIATTLKTKFSGGKDDSYAREEFRVGQQKYSAAVEQMDTDRESNQHQDLFIEAANHFRVAGANWPDSQLEEDALYYEGECQFFADRYVLSNRAFEKLIANYSGTRYLDLAEKRRFTIALYWLELADQYNGPDFTDPKRPKTSIAGEARRVLHRIRIDDPTGKLADDATLALGKAFLKDGSYYEAADAFSDLRRNYPGSKHQFTAHMLELQAHLSAYQGRSYDDSPLRRADELMKSIVRQFPEDAKEHLPYLEKQAALIRNQLAERDYAMGKFFERRGENRAAKFYYQKVAENFQDTQLADEIETHIERVAQLPPVPTPPAKWLVDLIPSEDDDKPIIAPGNNEALFR
jgi:tetratricopeptide (TPR) repeat protein